MCGLGKSWSLNVCMYVVFSNIVRECYEERHTTAATSLPLNEIISCNRDCLEGEYLINTISYRHHHHSILNSSHIPYRRQHHKAKLSHCIVTNGHWKFENRRVKDCEWQCCKMCKHAEKQVWPVYAYMNVCQGLRYYMRALCSSCGCASAWFLCIVVLFATVDCYLEVLTCCMSFPTYELGWVQILKSTNMYQRICPE